MIAFSGCSMMSVSNAYKPLKLDRGEHDTDRVYYKCGDQIISTRLAAKNSFGLIGVPVVPFFPFWKTTPKEYSIHLYSTGGLSDRGFDSIQVFSRSDDQNIKASEKATLINYGSVAGFSEFSISFPSREVYKNGFRIRFYGGNCNGSDWIYEPVHKFSYTPGFIPIMDPVSPYSMMNHDIEKLYKNDGK